jgi:hypothetical protein
MEKFMYLFRGGLDQTASPEAMQASMQKWQNWMQTLQKNNTMVGGEPLQNSGKQLSGTKKVVTDGPFIEAKEMVGGYLIVNAKNIDDAIEIAKGCPIFDSNGRLEIRPIQKMDM